MLLGENLSFYALMPALPPGLHGIESGFHLVFITGSSAHATVYMGLFLFLKSGRPPAGAASCWSGQGGVPEGL